MFWDAVYYDGWLKYFTEINVISAKYSDVFLYVTILLVALYCVGMMYYRYLSKLYYTLQVLRPRPCCMLSIIYYYVLLSLLSAATC